VTEGRVYSKEVDVSPGATVTLTDAQLELTGSEKLAMKDAVPAEAPYSAHSTVPRRVLETRLALGVTTGASGTFGSHPLYTTDEHRGHLERSFAGVGSFTYGITERLSWSAPVPAFTYRLGTEGAFEVLPRGGVPSFGVSSIEGFIGTLDIGVTTRAWLTSNLSLVSNTFAEWSFETGSVGVPGTRRKDFLNLGASLGLVRPVLDGRVTLAFGVGWLDARLVRPASSPDPAVPITPVPTSSAIAFGAVQTLGYRPLPLVQVHVTRSWSVDAYASWSVDLRTADVQDRYLGGFTYAW